MFRDNYLCISKDKKNFTCEYFSSFKAANWYYINMLSKDYKYSTILTSCSFVPNYFKYRIFDYKLNKLFKNTVEVKIKD